MDPEIKDENNEINEINNENIQPIINKGGRPRISVSQKKRNVSAYQKRYYKITNNGLNKIPKVKKSPSQAKRDKILRERVYGKERYHNDEEYRQKKIERALRTYHNNRQVEVN